MKTLAVLVIISVAAIATALPTDDLDKEWSLFKTKYGKKYETVEQETLRKNIFSENLNKVREHNSNHKRFYNVAINKFSDLSTEEVTNMIMGNVAAAPARSRRAVSSMDAPVKSASASLDWRSKGMVSDVKDQGYTNFGWAFATTGAYESEYSIKTGQKVALSEQSVIDCTRDHNEKYVWHGVSDTYDIGMLDTELSYPYTAEKGECKHNKTSSLGPVANFEVRALWSEADLLDLVSNVGPAVVPIDASHWGFHHYASGIYQESDCKSGLATDNRHAGLVVGFGSTGGNPRYSRDFWIVKNSFGPEWGENGYIRMRRNTVPNCFGEHGGAFYF